MRLSLSVLIAVLVCAVPVSADPARCAAFFAVMPTTLAGFREANRGSLPQTALGHFVRYDGPRGGFATVFVCDGGVPNVDDAVIQANLGIAVGDIATKHRVNGHTNARDRRMFEVRSGKVQRLVFAVTTDSGRNKAVRGIVALGQSGDCIVKLRLATPDSAEASKSFATMMSALETVLAP